MKIYNRFDIVVIPFPFADLKGRKHRPALILSEAKSFNKSIGHYVMAMITSAKHSPWPLDVKISNHKKSGLPKPSIVRSKIFTADRRLILKKVGILQEKDQKKVAFVLLKLFGLENIFDA